MRNSAQSILKSLITPRTLEEFFDHWPDRPLVVHGDLNRLPLQLRGPELGSFNALAERYQGNLMFTRGQTGPRMVSIDQVHPASLFHMGLTVYFENVAPCIPGMDPLLRQLESELGLNTGSVRIGVFASPKSDGVACHYDAQDIFSIQLQGSKRFHIAPVSEIKHPFGVQYMPGTPAFDDLYPQITNGFPDWQHENFETVEMRPGSVLYMPRGTWHHTEAGDDSLSASIVLKPPTAAECILEQLRLVLLQEKEWRRPLYGLWGEGELRNAALARTERLLSELPAITRGLLAEDTPLPTLPEDQRIRQFNPRSRFQKNPLARIETEPSPKEGHAAIIIKIVTKLSENQQREHISLRLSLPSYSFPVFEWIETQTAPFNMATLMTRFPTITVSEHRLMLEAATRGQLLKLLWFPSLVPEESNVT